MKAFGINFYRQQLGDLMLPSPNLGVAAAFYLLFAIAIVVLAIRPGLGAGSLWVAVRYGAVLGFAAYCTYDMTNLSTLKGWPVTLSIVDMIWGTVLTSVASAFWYAAELSSNNEDWLSTALTRKRGYTIYPTCPSKRRMTSISSRDRRFLRRRP